MSLEKSFNEYGQEQVIDNFDRIIKMGNTFLQVRLIRTQKWRAKQQGKREFTEPMPRAKFINPQEDTRFYYLVSKKDLIEMKRKQ